MHEVVEPMGCVLEDGIDCIAPRKHGGDSGRCSKEYDKQNYSISHCGHSGLCPGIAHHLLRKIRNKPIATIVNDPSAKMRGLSIGILLRLAASLNCLADETIFPSNITAKSPAFRPSRPTLC